MRFTPAKFDRLHANLGQHFRWRQRHACACYDPRSSAWDHRCPHCNGKGHLWSSAVDALATPASQSTQRAWAAMGRYETGDVVLTVPQSSPLWDAGEFDRVSMLNATDRFSMPLVRGAPGERLPFEPAALSRCFWKHPQTGTLLDCSLPLVDQEGRITWPPGASQPLPGASYSLTGTKHPEYFVYLDLPRNRNVHAGMRMPKQVVVRRFDLLGR